MARASTTEATGASGATEVMAEFERLNCGPIVNPQPHDLGTDLWVQVRDLRRFDRGLLIGAQVKTGPSFFAEPVGDPATPSGWIYREPAERFDDWVSHGLPHILVLRDQATNRSYWVHVVESAVTITGKRCSIVVPSENVLGPDSFERLLTVAASQKAARTYEGSAWKAGVSIVPPARRWRYALLAPRLVAPHPNKQIDALDSAEALALAAGGRSRDWDVLAERGVAPTIAAALGHKEWGWRFAARSSAWFTRRDTEVLADDPAPDLFAEAAQLVMRSVVLGATDRPSEAHDLLQDRISDEKAEDFRPVDYAWALTHLARRSAELGAIDQARDLAVQAQKALSGDDDDPTASDIAAASALLLLNTTVGWSQGAVEDTAATLDTATSWWRSRLVTSALGDYFKRTFDSWTRDESFTFASQDTVAVGLRAAADAWDLNGSVADWRASGSTFYRYSLTEAVFHGQIDDGSAALAGLCRVGDEQTVKKSSRHLRNHGPLSILASTASAIDEAQWTGSSALAVLSLWEVAADLMTSDAAESAAGLCLATLSGESTVITVRSPRLRTVPAVTSALTSLLPLCSSDIHREASAWAYAGAASGAFDDALWESEVRPLIGEIDFSLLDETARGAWLGLAEPSTERWSASVLSRLAEADDERARDIYVGRAVSGDLSAIYGLSYEALGDAGAKAVIDKVMPVLDRIVDDAEHGKWSTYGTNYGEIAGWVSVYYAHLADWAGLTRLATSQRVGAREKASLLARFASRPDVLPDHVRADLLSNIEAVASSYEPLMGDRGGTRGVAFRLEVGLNGGDKAVVESAVARLMLSTSRDEREDAALIIKVANDEALLPALAALLGDGDHRVAATAAYAIGALVDRDSGAIDPLLESAVNIDGRPIPLGLLSGLSEAPQTEKSLPRIASVTDALQSHLSFAVRMASTKLTDRLGAS